jgi:hypothetical protein
MKSTLMRGPLPKAIKPDEAGVVVAAGFTVNDERGTNQYRHTVIDMVNVPVTLTDDPGVGQFGGKKVFTLPRCAGIIHGAFIDGTLTLLAPFIAAASVEVSLGTATVAGGAAMAGTEKDILDRATAVSVALVNTFAQGAPAGLFFDGRAAPVDVYLNAVVADNAAHATTANNLYNGTVVLLWSPVTEPA